MAVAQLFSLGRHSVSEQTTQHRRIYPSMNEPSLKKNNKPLATFTRTGLATVLRQAPVWLLMLTLTFGCASPESRPRYLKSDLSRPQALSILSKALVGRPAPCFDEVRERDSGWRSDSCTFQSVDDSTLTYRDAFKVIDRSDVSGVGTVRITTYYHWESRTRSIAFANITRIRLRFSPFTGGQLQFNDAKGRLVVFESVYSDPPLVDFARRENFKEKRDQVLAALYTLCPNAR